MFGKKVIINLEKKDDIIHLEPISDVHIGHVGFDEDLYKRRLKAICRDKNRYTFLGGDMLDAITPYDKRFNPDMTTEHDVDNQRQKWQDYNEKLFAIQKEQDNEKVWAFYHGNHEYNIRQISRAYLENTMCNPNELTFMGSRAVMGLEVKYKNKILSQWSILFIHGNGGGVPERLMKQMKANNYYDVFLSGHLHQKRYHQELAYDFDWDKGGIWERDIHLGNTGTFCRTLTENTDGYMDRKNEVIGSQIGTITLSFNAEQGKIVGHI
jgi:predicted phosphodiesterase